MPRELPALYREFNGIDFGHAHLGETLLQTGDDAEIERARVEVLDFIFSEPPVPPDEGQVAPTIARLVWEIQRSFDWAHSFHRSLYDLFADDQVADKEGAYHQILGNYLSKPEAITFHPLDLHGKLWSWPESKSFRDRHRKFNSQIWAYHWLQGAVYDAQLMGPVARQRDLIAVLIDHYHGYLREPPQQWQMMPMLMETAPDFSMRFPEAAAIFDNLHMLHDNVDDVLTRRDLFPTRSAQRQRLLAILDIYLHRNHSGADRYSEYHAASGESGAMHEGSGGTMSHARTSGQARPADAHHRAAAADDDGAAHARLPDDIPPGPQHMDRTSADAMRDGSVGATHAAPATNRRPDAGHPMPTAEPMPAEKQSGMGANAHPSMGDMGPRPPSARDVLEGRTRDRNTTGGEASELNQAPLHRQPDSSHSMGSGL